MNPTDFPGPAHIMYSGKGKKFSVFNVITRFFDRTRRRRFSRLDYETGLDCQFIGTYAGEMTRNELIAFIGQLDALLTYRTTRWEQLQSERHAVEKYRKTKR